MKKNNYSYDIDNNIEAQIFKQCYKMYILIIFKNYYTIDMLIILDFLVV